MKHLAVRLKYSAARSIFNSLVGARVSSDVRLRAVCYFSLQS